MASAECDHEHPQRFEAGIGQARGMLETEERLAQDRKPAIRFKIRFPISPTDLDNHEFQDIERLYLGVCRLAERKGRAVGPRGWESSVVRIVVSTPRQ